MALGFPSDPAPPVGHIITLNGRDWKYDGTKWVLVGLQITDVEFRQSNPITVDQTFVGATGSEDPGYLGVVEYGMDIKSLPLLSETDPNPSGTEVTGVNPDETGIVISDPAPSISDTFNVVVVDNGTQNKYYINSGETPTLELVRGESYEFVFNNVGHPFWFQYTDNSNTYSEIDRYTLGMTGAGMEVGTMIFTVPEDAPNTLYYRCQFHSGMGGFITITNSVSTTTPDPTPTPEPTPTPTPTPEPTPTPTPTPSSGY